MVSILIIFKYKISNNLISYFFCFLANQPEILISKLVGTSVIPSIVRFIKSLNLGLQYVACKAIASLSAYGMY